MMSRDMLTGQIPGQIAGQIPGQTWRRNRLPGRSLSVSDDPARQPAAGIRQTKRQVRCGRISDLVGIPISLNVNRAEIAETVVLRLPAQPCRMRTPAACLHQIDLPAG